MATSNYCGYEFTSQSFKYMLQPRVLSIFWQLFSQVPKSSEPGEGKFVEICMLVGICKGWVLT